MTAQRDFHSHPQILLGVWTARLLRKFARRQAGPIFQTISGFLPGHQPVRLQRIDSDFCAVEAGGQRVVFPCGADAPVPLSIVHMMAVGAERWLREKYQMPGFVEVEPGDLVVDCGAFAGLFSRSAHERAQMIFAFEPSPLNHKALLQNIAGYARIRPQACGLYYEDKQAALNMSATHFDDSLLAPDEQATGQTQSIVLRRFENWARENNVTQVDFFKLEAEGVENEVLEGISSIPVRKFAVDCSPEREGKSNINEIRAALENRGYATKSRRYMLFARKIP
ncbi:MAG: FkbM family methyltransferase [Alphaproteobacteria bacterium]|nr:FkbM family methyltransferase [Alphaproteobacteria bacterium]